MTFIWILTGAILFVLGAIVSYFSGIRSLQASRRLADFRVRQRYLARARWSLAGGLLSVAVATVLLVVNRPAQKPASPSPSPQATGTTVLVLPAASSAPQASQTLTPAAATATYFVITPSPADTATLAATTTPFMPMAVQAMVQGSMTPVFPIQIGKLRFSTDISGLQLIAPGTSFHNPIKQVYAVFNYQPLAVKIQWTALWYHNGGLKYIDTSSWRNSPAGIGLTSWSQEPTAWLPGSYDVQIFVGTGWKASGSFTLQGDPPTITPTPSTTPTSLPATAIPSHTSTVVPTSSRTPAPAQTATPQPTRTPTATQTSTLQPTRTPVVNSLRASGTTAPATSTATASSTATRVPTSTSTATARPSRTANPIPSSTATKAATQTPSLTPTSSATVTPLPPTSTPTRTSTPAPLTIKMFFTNTQHIDQRVPPFNDMVPRQIPSSANPIAAALDEYFKGPNAEEQSHGLVGTWNGFVGYRRVEFANGVLNIYLTGNCRPNGTGYSIVQPLTQTLKQFPGVSYVKIYDEYGHTRDPFGNADSGPVCLDIIFSPTPTASNTPTRTPSPTATPVPSKTPTQTPVPTATASRTPTSTPVPTMTFTWTPSSTATLAPSKTPTRTPLPTATASHTPTSTPVPTMTFTWTPSSTATLAPSKTPTRTPLPTATASATPTNTLVPTRTPTRTPLPTATLVPSKTPTRTPAPTATASATPTNTLVPTQTPTRTPLPTATLVPSKTPTRTALPTATQVPSKTPSRTPTSTSTASRTATYTPLPTLTSTRTPPPTVSPLPSLTPTRRPLPTATASRTSTYTPVPTLSFTQTPRPTATSSRTPAPTATWTTTPTQTPSPRPPASATPTRTLAPSPTWTATATQRPLPTATQVPSRTPIPTWTSVPTRTATRTATPTLTPSSTATRTRTPQPTATRIPSRTPQPTAPIVPSATPTRTATPRPSSTPTNTATASPTATSSSTPTVSPTPTADPRCDRAEFVGDVTISDNTILRLSEPFTKTWRIRNSGTCTWTTGYKLAFTGGDQLGAPASVLLPINVAPGQTLDVSVSMVAPSLAGRYEGMWQLQTPDGRTFGMGTSGKDHIWVRIRTAAPAYATSTVAAPVAASTATATASASSTLAAVTPDTATPAAPQVTYDLADKVCEAQWQSNTGVLGCPGKEGDANGFVIGMAEAHLEDGSSASLPTLLTFPSSSADGYILGIYPEYEVHNGDHFQASVGCEQDATSCSVLFRLSYFDEASQPHDLWTLGEFYDGKYFNLDLDLSWLAGHKVKFALDVMPLGSATGDRALWVAPRIVHFPVAEATATSTPTIAVPPTSTPAPSMTATLQAAPTATLTIAPSPVPAAPSQPSSARQILDAIISFFQQLFGGK